MNKIRVQFRHANLRDTIWTEQTNITKLRDLMTDIVAAMENKNIKCLVGGASG